MANKIQLKRTNILNSIPATTDITFGELAINYNNGLVFFKDNNNSIKQIGWNKIDSGTNLGSTVGKQGIFSSINGTSIEFKSLVGNNGILQSSSSTEITTSTDPKQFQANVPLTLQDGTLVSIPTINFRMDFIDSTGNNVGLNMIDKIMTEFLFGPPVQLSGFWNGFPLR